MLQSARVLRTLGLRRGALKARGGEKRQGRMDEFCGDVKHAWGPTAKGYLTHCFDDVVLFGLTVR